MDTDSLRALRRAKHRIDRDYSGALGIDVLAAQAGYSPGHFIGVFRAAYGETPRRARVAASRRSCATIRGTGTASRSARC